MKFKISATIPVGQYANIIPEIETEAETFELAQTEALNKLKSIWEQYGVVPLKAQGNRKLVDCFVGGQVYYDEATHTYTNEAGDKYLSGSEYAASFKKPFDIEKIAAAVAKKIDAKPEDVIAMWQLKSEASKQFGTAIHSALELYERFNGLGVALEKTTHLHDHPILKQAVEGFYEAHKDEKAYSEIFVVDHQAKKVGQIDRLLIVDEKKKICRVQDFKTNADISKEIDTYWKQLEFYGEVMAAGDWTVQGLDIFWYTGVWEPFSKELVDVVA